MTRFIPRPYISMTGFLVASVRIFQPKTGGSESSMTIRNVFMKAEDKFPSSRGFHALIGKNENNIFRHSFKTNSRERQQQLIPR